LTMEQVTGAIGYLHRLGYIHGDISPENIMIDCFGKPMVVGVNALKLGERNASPGSRLAMNEDYAAPEMLDPGLGPQVASDVFALAGTLYCALSGAPPARPTSRLFRQDNDPYLPIEQVSQIACAPHVYAAIDAALALQIADRPQTVEEFAALLGWSP